MQKAFSRLAQTIALAFALLLSAGTVYAQVTVSMNDVTGRQGETVTVPVNIAGVTAATPINSFGFTVATPAGITFTGATNAGTLSAGQTVNSNPITGAVGGFGAGITSSGNLINLNFTYATPFTGTGTVTLTGFALNGGTPTFTPAVPSFGFVVSNRIMELSTQAGVVEGRSFELSLNVVDALAAADNVVAFNFDVSYDPAVMTIDKTMGNNGVITTGTLADGRTVNLNDIGGANSGNLRIGGFGAAITGAGTLVKIAFTAVNAGVSTSVATNAAWQDGGALYAIRNGITTVVVNSAPVAAAGTATMLEDGGSVDFTGTATDADGDAVTFSAATYAGTGSVTNVAGVYTYTPAADFNGTDTFTYTATDGTATSAAATVTVTVTAVNDAPTANAATATTLENVAVDVTLSGADVDGDALTFSAAASANGGTVTVVGTTATYTPAANYSGTDTFTYVANDGTVDSAPATVTVTVTQVNSPPVAAGIGAVTNEDTAVNVTFTATDADGDALTYALGATAPTLGTVTLAGAVATYTPTADANGTDTFTYMANDGTVNSAEATVTVTIAAVNDAPVATAVTATTAEDTAATITMAATDVDGDALTYTPGAAANGTITFIGAVATYTPAAHFNGTDTFTYVANDGTVDSAPATVTVTVSAVNDVPVASDLTATTAEDTSVDVALMATDSDNDTLTYVEGTAPMHGSVTFDGATATYSPTANYNGTDTFTYTAKDAVSTSNVATVTVTVTAVNDAPVFTAELGDMTVAEDNGVITFAYTATDVDGDALTYTLEEGPASATAVAGAFMYDPAGDAGTHTVIVSVSDGTVSVASASATIVVHAVNAIYTPLAGVHEVGPVATPAGGWVNVRLVEATGMLEVSGVFSNLSGTYSGSHIHAGAVGMSGAVVVPLSPTVGADGRSGTFNVANNSFDLTAATYPTGMDMAGFIAALKAGGTYVNVHSAAHGPGEIRGQLLGSGNVAPAASTVRAPGSVTISGAPDDALFSVSWLPAADANGDTVHYLFEMTTDAAFTQHVRFESMGAVTGHEFTVKESAKIFDEITGRDPGAIDVGGSVTVYMRIISSDGSLWSVGPADEMTLTRGIVTANEDEADLPTEFALKGNYPNPFNPSTTIQFDLPQTADVNILVVDLLGRQVMDIPTQTIEAGANRSVQFDASSLASGIYMYRVVARMQNDTRVKVGTMTLIK